MLPGEKRSFTLLGLPPSERMNSTERSRVDAQEGFVNLFRYLFA